jgi:adenine-specific DNA-methyltransferase
MATFPDNPIVPALLDLLPTDGTSRGNAALRYQLEAQLGREVSEADYRVARDALVEGGWATKGKGRGGSLCRAVPSSDAGSNPATAAVPNLELTHQPEPPSTVKDPASGSRGKSGNRESKASGAPPVISYRHDQRRTNNPEVGMVDPDSDPAEGKNRWAYDPHIDPALQFDSSRAGLEKLIDDALASGDEAVMRRALEQLKRQAEPYLNWAGKAERTSFEVDTVSLHVHERIDPASILTAIRKRMTKSGGAKVMQEDMFQAWFERPLPYREAIEFYKHDRGWANRLISGDSLLVMNSLLQKEGMAGQVQMIYLDPPYGIKYGSNFQPFVSKRDVKDRKDEDLTQEPEMIKAFRDTWELGIHSYLTYLRDRLLLAKTLLSNSGSLFVQISDDNQHHIRELLDEVFGHENFLAQIAFVKTSGLTADTGLTSAFDYVVWYGKNRLANKSHDLFAERVLDEGMASQYGSVVLPDLSRRRLARHEASGKTDLPIASKRYRIDNLTKPGPGSKYRFAFEGRQYESGGRWWGTTPEGMSRVAVSRRLQAGGETVYYVRLWEDFPFRPFINLWVDTAAGGFAEDRVYVVQTGSKVVERLLLMSTDPGDLVLDPTCGSGTTAFVAEKWGRRWITCDTSRVAITLAKQRLMTASYDYYDLKYSHEGLRGGFIYKSVPHVTLKSIANNPEIDEIWERMHPAIEQSLAELNSALRKSPPDPFEITEGGRKGSTVDFGAKAPATVKLPSGENAPAGALLEWEAPFDYPEDWPPAARAAFDSFHKARQAMQKQMDASIAAHADQELLYDQPQIAKNKLRVTGPFTVEAVPFPSVISLEKAETGLPADQSVARSGESARQHTWRDELLKTGIRGKGGQMLRFAELETLPGTRHLHCTGSLAESGDRAVVSFGPEHAALEQRQVEMALREAGELFPRPKMIVFAAFAFDPEAAKDIDATKGLTALKAQMNTDLLTDDLKKARSSNQSFWLMGQPDVEVRQRKDGKYEVEVNGFDYFDTVKGELVSGGKKKIAAWSLDTDYDERSLFPRQVFFPMAGAKDGWHKLKKDLKAELNEAALEKLHGTVSLPFDAGDNRKVAVKIVDDRGIESLKVMALP